MDRTDRVFLVGEGARRFATAHGFPDEELLTEKTRKIWLHWKNRLSDLDDWIEAARDAEDPDVKRFLEKYGAGLFRPQGTIHLSVRSAKGDLVGVTTTSGLFFKIPGRVGDSPVIGAGLFSENGVGSAGSTGRGEANLVTCGSHTVVEYLRNGLAPEEACLARPEADRREDPPRPEAPRREGPAELQRQLLLRRRGGTDRRRRHLERVEVRPRRRRRRPRPRERLPLQEGRLTASLLRLVRATGQRRAEARRRGDR